ncbi:MAG: 3-deoxy-manno-octulosonate cytidylyltransferase [Xanthomonadales bacterium]|nr:3-deoxy-manno-octulosonate cytidylyltransferase [Xanthomonadales bacterium]MDH3941866.1 3-deoxy-manno-octulosonate cytidylyltransferase [Xanthomonadales bacterium]
MTCPYHIVIPARLASQRLPNKPLAEIGGRTLIEHVYRRACEANAASVIIATDSKEIHSRAKAFGAHVLMTSAEHESGSDRLAECVERMSWNEQTLVVNLQGDEPLMPAACLDQVADLLSATPDAAAASLYYPIQSAEEIADSNVVKVVLDASGRALYFSRSVIPHVRGESIEEAVAGGASWKRHVGLYAYRVGALKAFTRMEPGFLEGLEKLEQLRFLEAGYRMVLANAVDFIPAGVDTAEDLERVRRALASSD